MTETTPMIVRVTCHASVPPGADWPTFAWVDGDDAGNVSRYTDALAVVEGWGQPAWADLNRTVLGPVDGSYSEELYGWIVRCLWTPQQRADAAAE